MRSRLLVLVATLGLATAATVGVASAANPGDEVSADGTTVLGPVDFAIAAGPDGELTGYFTGDVTLGGETSLAHAEGPPTCLTVEGDKAAFVYRVTDAGDAPTAEPQGIYVSMQDGGEGGQDRIGFAGPAPIADLGTCPIGPAPLEFTGDMDVTAGG